MKFISRSARPVSSVAGATLVEILIAGTISVLVMGALLSLVLQLAKEQKYGLSDGAVHQQAGLMEERILQLLRSMNATESVLFADPVSGSPGLFRRVIVAQGQWPTFPRQEVYFNATKCQLIHDPDRNVGGNEVVLCRSNTMATLREMYFYPSLKTGNVTDSTTLNVVMKFDDNGYPMRKDSAGKIKRMSANRYFTVKLRN